MKLQRVYSGTCTRLTLSQITQKHTSLSRKQREEEDLSFKRLFWRFNLQTIQALKAKNNLKQVIKNVNQVMEEEDLLFRTLFFLQSANNPTPKQQKQPKPSTSKCNCNTSSSITQQKIPHPHPLKHPKLRTNLHSVFYVQDFSYSILPHTA